MTLDHELRPFKAVSFQVVDEYRAIGVLFGHFGSVLPGKEVLRALRLGHGRVQRAEFKSIKLAID